MSTIIAILLAYALGLAFAGYISVLWALNKGAPRGKMSARRALIAAHFLTGIGGMVIVPAYLYGRLKQSIDANAAVAFGVCLVLTLCIAFWVARTLNNISDH